MVTEPNRTSSITSGEAHVIETAFRYPVAPPTMDGGERAFGQARDGGGAPECIDQDVGWCLHSRLSATIAGDLQEKSAIMVVAIVADQLLVPAMTPAEIRAALAARNMSIRDLAEATGINENYLTKSLGKTARRIQLDEMAAIARVFQDDEVESSVPALRKIPLFGSVPAGTPQPADQHNGRWHAVSDPETPARAYALTVEGDSMDLVVPNGATLVIDPDDTDLWPDRHYVVMTEDGSTTFKEFQADPARLVPVSSNDMHQEIRLGSEPVKVLGSVFSYTLRTPPRRGGLARIGGSRQSQPGS